MVTNVKTQWVDGDLYFYDKSGDEIFHIDGANRALVMHASAGFTAPLEMDATDIAANAVTTTKIIDGAVTGPKLAAGAGVAALLTAGLGGSASVAKATSGATVLVAANATKARACLVLVVVDEVYADAGGTQPTLVIGEVGTTNKAMTIGILHNAAAGSVWAFAFTNTANVVINATSVAAVTTGTGGCTITVLAIPTT